MKIDKILNFDVPLEFRLSHENAFCKLYTNDRNKRIRVFFTNNVVIEKQFINNEKRFDGCSFCRLFFPNKTYVGFKIINNGFCSKRIIVERIK